MRWLRSIAREVLGLFVDDGSFALAILVWVVIVCLPVIHGSWRAPSLFLGLACILIKSVLRFSCRRTK